MKSVLADISSGTSRSDGTTTAATQRDREAYNQEFGQRRLNPHGTPATKQPPSSGYLPGHGLSLFWCCCYITRRCYINTVGAPCDACPHPLLQGVSAKPRLPLSSPLRRRLLLPYSWLERPGVVQPKADTAAHVADDMLARRSSTGSVEASNVDTALSQSRISPLVPEGTAMTTMLPRMTAELNAMIQPFMARQPFAPVSSREAAPRASAPGPHSYS